jgi:hypothetical protein
MAVTAQATHFLILHPLRPGPEVLCNYCFHHHLTVPAHVDRGKTPIGDRCAGEAAGPRAHPDDPGAEVETVRSHQDDGIRARVGTRVDKVPVLT